MRKFRVSKRRTLDSHETMLEMWSRLRLVDLPFALTSLGKKFAFHLERNGVIQLIDNHISHVSLRDHRCDLKLLACVLSPSWSLIKGINYRDTPRNLHLGHSGGDVGSGIGWRI